MLLIRFYNYSEYDVFLNSLNPVFIFSSPIYQSLKLLRNTPFTKKHIYIIDNPREKMSDFYAFVFFMSNMLR